MIIRYKLVDGEVRREILTQRRHTLGEERPPGHFSERLLKNYYELECQQGSRFRSGYRKSVIKRAHETAIQRFEQTGKT